jgi:hypothetical protein
VPETARESQSPLTTLLWAAFLGMSWNWCIGMFLPVILVREFGVAGWIVFAVPNILGAAAMGWVLRSRESSIRITESHATACVAFSWVTIAFHLYFILWLVRTRLFNMWTVFIFFAFFILFSAVGRRRDRNDLFMAAITFLVSVVCIALALSYANSHDLPAITPRPSQWAEASLLATVCIFGFVLCPYLDLTFHRARQNTSPRAARLAFGLGFGLFFLVMIVFTLWYAPYLATVIHRPRLLPEPFAAIMAVHMLVQSALTIALHLRHAAQSPGRRLPLHDLIAVFFVLSALVLAVLVRDPHEWFFIDAGELVYRCFMGFYALVFPTYVWLCMIPGRGASPPTRRQLLVFASAVIIALPMFWLGFIHQRLIWLAPGVLISLLARFAVPRSAKVSS